MKRHWMGYWILLLWMLSEISMQACPVCFSARDGSREAFLLTTVLLSCLPWAMVGGFVFWVRKKHKRQTHSANQGH